ncbi:MAG: sulfotransferase family protein [Actinomycetota bacterium]
MMLNAHPQVAVPPESRFVVELFDGSDVVRVDDLLRRLEAHKRWRTWDLPIESVAAEFDGVERAPYAEVLETCYQAFARTRNKSFYGDKTPRYVEHIDLLHRLWPRARFVHLVRDGREIALSYADVPFGPKTVAKAARLWDRRVGRGMAAGRTLPEGQYLEVRYERLLEDPEECSRGLTSFLGIPFAPGMLEFNRLAKEEVLERANLYNPHVTERIARTRSWAEQMPASQVEIFEAVAGETLSALGYERRFPHPGITARISAGLGLAGAPLGRLRGTRKPFTAT